MLDILFLSMARFIKIFEKERFRVVTDVHMLRDT